jgi:SAM-dependent methyltransferase
VGLDVSESELAAAPAESYDDVCVTDVNHLQHELEGKFDVVLSWQVLEHVKPLATAVEHMRAYLKPGGVMASQLSGSFSLFGIVNKVVPTRLGVWAMRRLLDRDPDTVFPAHYDGCHYDALRSLRDNWTAWEVCPRFKGGGYFSFAKPVYWTYLKYENAACRHAWNNLASHYIVTGTR